MNIMSKISFKLCNFSPWISFKLLNLDLGKMCEPCNSGKGKSQGKVREIQRTWVPILGEVAEKVIFRLCGLDFSKIADLYGSHLFFFNKTTSRETENVGSGSAIFGRIILAELRIFSHLILKILSKQIILPNLQISLTGHYLAC